MGVNRLRGLWGTVLWAAATIGVAAAHGATVPPSPDLSTVEAPLEFEHSAPPVFESAVDPSTNEAQSAESSANARAKGPATFQSPADHGELLWVGDLQSPEPSAWSPGFAGGSLTSGSSPASGGGYVFISEPDQVLIPLPSAAWTGLTGLVGLGAFGMMKHARRFFR